MNKLPILKIGDITIRPPIIMGGMGVRITNHALAAAAANCGIAGTIASVGLCDRKTKAKDYVEESNKALAIEIKKAKRLSKGVIGVNIMGALTNFDELVKTSIGEKADFIITGAGLPLNLPELALGSKIPLIPIISSAKAADIICKKWSRKHHRLPDAFVVEGGLAGGHLGMRYEEIRKWDDNTLIDVCTDVKRICAEHEENTGKKIPVIAAGGIFDGKDIARVIKAGIDGVQMATRFIATKECPAPDNFKALVLNSKKEDMLVIKSPVGLPGRVIRNKFVEKILKTNNTKVDCPYHCLRTCNPDNTPFCIAQALVNAHEGDLDNGIVMAGYNAYRLNKITSVRELVEELVSDTLKCLS
jgi:nitronate monooxygenase